MLSRVPQARSSRARRHVVATLVANFGGTCDVTTVSVHREVVQAWFENQAKWLGQGDNAQFMMQTLM